MNIPDTNFKAKLLSANTSNGIAKNSNGQNIILDTNYNGEIETTEALNVYRLEFYSSNISNITGITNFIKGNYIIKIYFKDKTATQKFIKI